MTYIPIVNEKTVTNYIENINSKYDVSGRFSAATQIEANALLAGISTLKVKSALLTATAASAVASIALDPDYPIKINAPVSGSGQVVYPDIVYDVDTGSTITLTNGTLSMEVDANLNNVLYDMYLNDQITVGTWLGNTNLENAFDLDGATFDGHTGSYNRGSQNTVMWQIDFPETVFSKLQFLFGMDTWTSVGSYGATTYIEYYNGTSWVGLYSYKLAASDGYTKTLLSYTNITASGLRMRCSGTATDTRVFIYNLLAV
jgi:hypothetical protein